MNILTVQANALPDLELSYVPLQYTLNMIILAVQAKCIIKYP